MTRDRIKVLKVLILKAHYQSESKDQYLKVIKWAQREINRLQNK